MQGDRAVRCVEREDTLVPARPGKPLCFLGLKPRAAGDDEDVVGKNRAVVEQNLVPLDPDLDDLVLVEGDVAAQLPVARAHDLVGLREPEGHEEQAGLVDVRIVSVDDVDFGLVGVEVAAEPVRDHRSTGAAAEDDDPFLGHGPTPASRGRRHSRCSTNSIPVSIDRRSGHAAATFSSRSSCSRFRSPVTRMSISNRRGVA